MYQVLLAAMPVVYSRVVSAEQPVLVVAVFQCTDDTEIKQGGWKDRWRIHMAMEGEYKRRNEPQV